MPFGESVHARSDTTGQLSGRSLESVCNRDQLSLDHPAKM